ncbi:MAG: hypothetical protein B7Z23_08210 [Pseudomonadales bacterium 32-61-5]|nr:MAG: hypothetical protein B7Z23_08210 [Pseudomonadales bacterium 32-61-5]
MNLPQLPQDKANHFVYGSLICLAALIAAPPLLALALAAAAGLGKEIYDRLSRSGEPSIPDAVATIAGATSVFLATLT